MGQSEGVDNDEGTLRDFIQLGWGFEESQKMQSTETN
jgi:hypothetical protein